MRNVITTGNPSLRPLVSIDSFNWITFFLHEIQPLEIQMQFNKNTLNLKKSTINPKNCQYEQK